MDVQQADVSRRSVYPKTISEFLGLPEHRSQRTSSLSADRRTSGGHRLRLSHRHFQPDPVAVARIRAALDEEFRPTKKT